MIKIIVLIINILNYLQFIRLIENKMEVDTINFHIWSDALHARQLAREANNKWDRGTYVRWTIITAWIAFELTCEDVLETSGLGYRFKENLDEAIRLKGLENLNWDSAVWQGVLKVHHDRKNYIHINTKQEDLFLEVKLADDSIKFLRKGIAAIYEHTGNQPPSWLDYDKVKGWDNKNRSIANATVIHKGVDEDDPNVYKLAYVREGREFISEVFIERLDFDLLIDKFISSLNVPVSIIRIYQGKNLIKEREVKIRGN